MRSPHIDVHIWARLRLAQPVTLKCVSKVKKWAYDNAWTLIVMAVGFALTWGYLLFQGVKRSVG